MLVGEHRLGVTSPLPGGAEACAEEGRWPAIELDAIGKLNSPVLIAAFEGWNDAGEAASSAISQLTLAWDAKSIGAIDPEDYYDFQVTRPVMEVAEGQAEELIWPTTRLALARPAEAERRKATRGLVGRGEDILGISLPLADLPAEARAWERGVDELAEQDSDVAEYVRSLEEAKDATDLPEASGDAIAREFERYLRRRGDRGEHGR